jgi:hypothetical protein
LRPPPATLQRTGAGLARTSLRSRLRNGVACLVGARVGLVTVRRVRAALAGVARLTLLLALATR